MAKTLEQKLGSANAPNQLLEVLSVIEPELNLLTAVIANIEALTTTADQIDPRALIPLAHVGQAALDSATDHWREALSLVRSSNGAPPRSPRVERAN